jgi:hypothetical protein
MTRSLAALVAVLIAAVAARAQAAAIRLVPMPAREAVSSGPSPTLLTSFAEAEAAARRRHVLLLLYFTAKW